MSPTAIGHRSRTARLLAAAMRLSSVLLVGSGVTVLIGWIGGSRQLATLWMPMVPIRPVAAVGVVLIGLALQIHPTSRKHLIPELLGAVVVVLNLIGAVGTIFGLSYAPMTALRGYGDWYDIAHGPSDMPLISAIALMLLGTALVMQRRSPRLAHLLAVMILFIVHSVILAQLFDAGLIYRVGRMSAMSIAVSLQLAVAATGLIIRTPNVGLMRFVLDSGPAGVLMRRIALIVPLGLAGFSWTALFLHEHGYIDHSTVAAVLAGSGLLIVTVVAWSATTRIKRLEEAQQEAYRELAKTNVELEDRVARRTTEIKERTAHFTAAFEAAPVGMALLDLTGQPIRANSALLRKLGKSDVSGMPPLTMLAHPDDRDVIVQQRARLLAGETEACRVELRVPGQDSDNLWVSATASLLRDSAGEPSQILQHVVNISEQKKHQSELQHIADHDALTGLLNRRGFDEYLAQHTARHRRTGDGGALLLVDLDYFKSVNDLLGHQRGDEVLIAVARGIESRLRQDDVVARLGGDEFAVLIPQTDIAAVERVAKIIVDTVRERAAALTGLLTPPVTASVGVAIFDSSDLTVDELLRRADRAMYSAKNTGRNRWVRYAEALAGLS